MSEGYGRGSHLVVDRDKAQEIAILLLVAAYSEMDDAD